MRSPTAASASAAVVPLRGTAPTYSPLPPKVSAYPELRYMGSKARLLPWIHDTLNQFDFESALDPFSGTG